MANVHEIGPYSAYAIAVKYGYKGTEEEWVQEQEANRKAAEAAAAAAAQSAKDAAASASGAAQSGQQAVQNIKNAQTAAEQAIDTAKQQVVQAVKDEGAAQTTALNDAAEAHKNELESIASHPPQPNTATGKWQIWNAETGAYQDTDALYQGGYYTPAVSDDGVLTWQGSQAGMPSLPSANVKGPKGDKGDPGLGVPTPTTSDAGKVPTVKADGSAYELAGPYAPISAAIRPTASGNPVSIADSVEWSLQGLKIYGKSTQDGTPSPENPVPIVNAGEGGNVEVLVTGKNLLDISKMQQTTKNGITFSLENGGIKISGTATAKADSPIFTFRLPAGTYISNINKKSFPWLSSSNYVVERDGSNFWLGSTIAFTILDKDIGKFFYFTVKDGETVNEIIYPQLEVGSTVTPYAPYKSQSLNAATPNGLPGIPVSSDGNYTDGSGQQLVCNYKDYERGVYVQRCALEKIVGTPNFTETSNNPGRYSWANALTNIYAAGETKSLSTFGTWSRWGASGENGFAVDAKSLYFYYAKSNAADEVNALFSNLIATNQCYVLGQLATPAETPLSEEEIAAYRALHTYDGATVVSTAEDVAGLEVKYLADGEKYVERIVSQKAPEAAAAHTMALLADGIREGVNGV